MAENQEKIDELVTKLKALGQRVKSTRDGFGSPLVDRVFERLNRISAKLPNNGHAASQLPQPEEAKISCPKCGVQAVQGVHFCSSCSFDYFEESRKQMRQQVEREKLEQSARMGVKI